MPCCTTSQLDRGTTTCWFLDSHFIVVFSSLCLHYFLLDNKLGLLFLPFTVGE